MIILMQAEATGKKLTKDIVVIMEIYLELRVKRV